MLIFKLRPKVSIRRNNPIFLNLIRHNSNRFFLENDTIADHKHDPISNDRQPQPDLLRNRDYLEPKDEIQIKVKNLLTSRKPILNPIPYYQSIPTFDISRDIDYDEFDQEPFTSFELVVSRNTNNPPVVGSVVEYVNQSTNTISLGVVLREARSKFNENYNKLMVLTSDNIIESVSPTLVTFHLYDLVKSEWVNSLNILQNRFDAAFPGRSSLISVLVHFVNKSLQHSQELKPQFDIVFGQYSLSYNITPISLIEIIESLKLSESLLSEIDQSYFHQCVLLMSLHMNLVDSPKWIVPSLSLLNRSSNIMSQFSNSIVEGSHYFVNSEYNAIAVDKLVLSSQNEILFEECDRFLSQLYNDQTSHKKKPLQDLTLYFNIWEGRHHKFLIDILKFAIIYPHPKLISLLERFDIFSNQTPLSPYKMYDILKQLNIYEDGINNEKDPSHPLLSANIFGKGNLNELSATSPNQLSSPNFDVHHSPPIRDHFQHLRRSKVYYRDHTIYGMPYKTEIGSDVKESILAISLEKINSRKYRINIHIPDIMTKIAPDSDIMKVIASSSARMKVVEAAKRDFENGIFGSLNLDQYKFKNQNIEEQNENEWVSASDLIQKSSMDSIENVNLSETTCLTLSFLYNSFESNPFSNLENKVSYSFDTLSSVCIKNISWRELEECLKGKSETSNAFRLFTRPFSTLEKTPKLLNNDDIHNVCFIHNIMKTHVKLRNLEGASIIEPTESFGGLVYKEDGWKSLPKSKFFISEIEKFVANLSASYCQYHKIPILTHEQNLVLDNDEEFINQSQTKVDPEDNALVTHHNTLLPSFYADTYYQTLLSRDINGYVSIPAYIIGRNYLQRSSLLVNSGKGARNVPLGLVNGFVNLCNVFQDFEAVINQLQILSHIQSEKNISFMQNSQNRLSLIERFSYLKGLGYNLNGPMGPSVLKAQLRRILGAQSMISHLKGSFKSFNVLKQLEKSLQYNQQSDTVYTCYVTHQGYRMADMNFRMVKGFCKELDIEVDILASESSHISIGSTVSCDKVMYLDPIGSQCILKEVEGF